MKINYLNESVFAGNIAGMDTTLGPVSYNVQGSQPGYVYRILPLTNNLQQKGTPISNEYYIYPGCKVRGKGFNNPNKHFTGIVQRIVKDSNGEIVCLYIRSLKTNKFVTITPDDIELIIPPQPEPLGDKTNYIPGISNNVRIN